MNENQLRIDITRHLKMLNIEQSYENVCEVLMNLPIKMTGGYDKSMYYELYKVVIETFDINDALNHFKVLEEN